MTLNVRRFGTNLLLMSHDAETGLEGGRENGWIVDNNPPDFNPFLLLLPSLGSSKFVQKLRILLGVSFHGYRVTEVDFEEMTI